VIFAKIPGFLIVALILSAARIADAERDDASIDLARGDAAWAARAEGADDRGNAAAGRIEQAIAAYQDALALEPDRPELHWKYVRALYFAGEFASADDAASEQWFDRARGAARVAVDVLDEAIAITRPLDALAPEEIAAVLPAVSRHDVAALHLWSAIAWGAWTRYNGVLSIVRSGAPGKLKRYADIVVALEPALEQGGGHRLLAALHRSLPRVPLYTGWVDRDRAFVELDDAMAIAPGYPGNQLLSALTLLQLAPDRRDEALSLLEKVAAITPDPDETVEQLAMRAAARERLEEEGRGLGPW
jgi:tetratricopeptide (TPR) repeat protein